jgi:hypothetical protein
MMLFRNCLELIRTDHKELPNISLSGHEFYHTRRFSLKGKTISFVSSSLTYNFLSFILSFHFFRSFIPLSTGDNQNMLLQDKANESVSYIISRAT